jgi:VRR-NUC domain
MAALVAVEYTMEVYSQAGYFCSVRDYNELAVPVSEDKESTQMITPLQYQEMQQRVQRKSPEPVCAWVPTESEKELHSQILRHCREKQLIAFHGSMAHSTCRTAGEPDFVLMLPGGRWLAIECKSRQGKLSAAQMAISHWAQRLGHTIHVVRSFGEFLELVK